jgi:hypothetical protein
MSDEQESKDKVAFAAALLKYPNEPFRAALEIYPQDGQRGLALRVATEWPFDSEVLLAQKTILETKDELDFLPSKADAARAIWALANPSKDGGVWIAVEERIKAMKLYCEVRGFIDKSTGPAVVVNNNDNKVMIVKDMGTIDEWETKALLQQKQLQNVSTSKH